MGYYTTYTGEITITPPLTWAEIKDSPFLPNDAFNIRDLKFEVTREDRDTAEGTLIRREAIAVVPLTDDTYKGYDVVEHLQEILDAFPGHEFTGSIRAEGEEAGDIWRLDVVDGRAVKVKPRIVWPDGTEEAGR